MRIKKGFLLVVLFFSIHSFGQNINELSTQKQVDCSDVAFNSSLFFVKYMRENKIDSAKSILIHWTNECGISEPIYRAKILLALKTGELNKELLTEKPIDKILKYQNRMDMIKYLINDQYDRDKSYYGFIPLNQEFDNYTQELALDLKTKYNPTSIEYLFTELYSDNYDTIFTKIQTKSYRKSVLTQEYREALEEVKKIPEAHVASCIGVWIPTGNLKIIGVHPELGFQVGMKRKKMNYDLTVAFRFLVSPNAYLARNKFKNNCWQVTHYFSGRYIGLETGFDILSKNRHEIQAIGGIGYDGFTVLHANSSMEKRTKQVFTSTYNFNLGLAYRYYITHYFYIGLRAKYNIVDYTLNKVIDFTGNPITVQFTVGTVFNWSRYGKLEDLKYKRLYNV